VQLNLAGGGRKAENPALEDALMVWVDKLRSQHLRVSRKMLQVQALEMYRTGNYDVAEVEEGEDGKKSFCASNGWLQKFFSRHDITVRYVCDTNCVLLLPVLLEKQ
jgi:hypothetical protein